MHVVAVVPNALIRFSTLVGKSSGKVTDADANKVVHILRDLHDAGVNRALQFLRKHVLHVKKL